MSKAPYAVKRAVGEFEERLTAKNVHINQLYDVLEGARVALIEGRERDALALVEMALPRLPPAEPADLSKEELAAQGHEPGAPAQAAPAIASSPISALSTGDGLAVDPNAPLTVGLLLQLLPMLQRDSAPRQRGPSRGVSVVEHAGAPPARTRTTVTEHAPEPKKGPKVEYHD